MTCHAACSTATASGCTIHSRRIPFSPNLPAVNEQFSRLRLPSILGGNDAKTGADGFSYWAAEPVEVLHVTSDQPDPIGHVQQALDRYTTVASHRPDLPEGLFCGGWIGFFSYDLGRVIEPASSPSIDDLHMQLVRLAFYDRVLAYDHRRQTVWLVAVQMPTDTEAPNQKLDHLERLLEKSACLRVAQPCPADMDRIDLSQVACNMTKPQYLAAVARIKRHIVDGDVYQINFSQRFACPFTARPIDLFHWENAFNPSPYSAYIEAQPFDIVSASPEMFLTICSGSIQTKPIKGTRPRIAESSAQARLANEKAYQELVASEKEQAELAMIVDLERNDLARVCIPGTRQVLMPRTIETCPTVFHAVAVVGGRLRPRVSFCDILKASFPGGSITGAPKIRAMEIINAVEPTARGLYTGSIGFIGVDGTACLNIAIRTVIITREMAYVQVGGGIVADSVPQAEYDETLTKARALLAGIDAIRIRE